MGLPEAACSEDDERFCVMKIGGAEDVLATVGSKPGGGSCPPPCLHRFQTGGRGQLPPLCLPRPRALEVRSYRYTALRYAYTLLVHRSPPTAG